MTWEEKIRSGTNALGENNTAQAEEDFQLALAFAKQNFFHNDRRIAQSLAYLGIAHYLSARLEEAKRVLSQSAKLAANTSDEQIDASIVRLCKNKTTDRDHALQPFLDKQQIAELGFLLTGKKSAAPSAKSKPALAQNQQKKSKAAPPPAVIEKSSKPVQLAPEVIESIEEMIDDTPDFEQDLQRLLARLDRTSIDNNVQIYGEIDDLLYTAFAALPPVDLTTALVLNALGVAAAALMQFERAEKLYTYSINMMHKLLSEHHPLIGKIRLNLAILYRDHENFERADLVFRLAIQALQNDPELNAGWLEDMAHSFDHMMMRWQATARAAEQVELANQFVDSNDWHAANQAYHRAYMEAANAFAPDHIAYKEIFEPLSAVKEKLGLVQEAAQLRAAVADLEQAESDYREGLRAIERRLPPMPPLVPLDPHHH